MKDNSLLTGRLLRRAEKLLEYDFDVIYQSKKKIVVPDFLSRFYLMEMLTSGRVKSGQQIASQKNNFFVPFADKSQLFRTDSLNIHWTCAVD